MNRGPADLATPEPGGSDLGLGSGPLRRTRIMGVVNVTPDSFSDGGRYFDAADAIRHGLDLLAEGADILDVGGESTRPGATRVDAEEERRRVLPVISALVAEGARVSVDTTRVRVAEDALNAGASILNDVSGAQAEPRMAALAAAAGVPLIVMHWREASATMQSGKNTEYDDVVADVAAELGRQLEVVFDAGVAPEKIIVDPGLGFSKTGEHNWQLLAGLSEIRALGYPVLVAASRKRFLSTLLGTTDLGERDEATAAVSALAAAAGAWCVRVHSVPASRIAVRVARAWRDHDRHAETAGRPAVDGRGTDGDVR